MHLLSKHAIIIILVDGENKNLTNAGSLLERFCVKLAKNETWIGYWLAIGYRVLLQKF